MDSPENMSGGPAHRAAARNARPNRKALLAAAIAMLLCVALGGTLGCADNSQSSSAGSSDNASASASNNSESSAAESSSSASSQSSATSQSDAASQSSGSTQSDATADQEALITKYYSIEYSQIPDVEAIVSDDSGMKRFDAGNEELYSGHISQVAQGGMTLFEVIVSSTNWYGVQGDFSIAVLPGTVSTEVGEAHIVVIMGNDTQTHEPKPFSLEDGTVVSSPQDVVDLGLVKQL